MIESYPAEIQQVIISGSDGLSVSYVTDKGGVWHYHPEFEIMLNISCNGTRIVGDSIEIFDNYDLVLIPGNMPHCWNYYRYQDSLPPRHSVIAHFNRNIFGDTLLYQHEMSEVRELFDEAQWGISFSAGDARDASKFMEGMTSHSGIEKLIDFLNVLRILCNSKHRRKLCSEKYRIETDDSNEKEMAEAYNYIREYYRKPISLEEISRIAGMKPHSFSKVFKKHTGSGFVEFVNQVRTDRACYLLRESRAAIHDIAEECGFASLSNFNKQFRKIMGVSPRTYREQLTIKM
ncbi:MAG TPA: AraC family transcriptional regulator [Bacteroidales bacterium]|nr:AraC family transcriptional regulator [Bacteroidales bacterium]HRT90020.1 AraC family transcriptional regulator [Bacteroidales bacterium]